MSSILGLCRTCIESPVNSEDLHQCIARHELSFIILYSYLEYGMDSQLYIPVDAISLRAAVDRRVEIYDH